ncbi:MAG: hypothetical protein AAGJ93_08755, partial [Bacteroidota bacterium]
MQRILLQTCKHIYRNRLSVIPLSILLLLLLPSLAFSQIYYINSSSTIAMANDVGTNLAPNFITGGNDISDLYIDETSGFIYWVNSGNGTIGRADSDGNNVMQSFITTGSNPVKMTIEGGFVYYTHSSGIIGRAPITGGIGDNTFLTDGSGGGIGATEDLAVTTIGAVTSLYWVNPGSSAISQTVSIGGMIFAPFFAVTGLDTPTELILTPTGDLFWLDEGTNQIGSLVSGVPDLNFATGVTGNSLYLDEDREKILWNSNSMSIGTIDSNGANRDNTILDNLIGIAGGLHAKIEVGIVISSFNEMNDEGCPGNFSFSSFVNFNKCDLNDNASYTYTLTDAIGSQTGNFDDMVCSLDFSGGTTVPGGFNVIATISDPDGVNSSAIPSGNIISSSANSVTFDAGGAITYGKGIFQPDGLSGEKIAGPALPFLDPPVNQAVYSVSTAYEAGLSGGSQIATTASFTWTVGGTEITSANNGSLITVNNMQVFATVSSSGLESNLTLDYFSGSISGDFTISVISDNCGQDMAERSFSLLPVEFLSFDAMLQSDQTTLLEWQTANEENNEGFDVQRSTDGQHWEKLGFVAGNGTTQEKQSYNYVDRSPVYGVNYYRLLQRDFDGQTDYSDVVLINSTKDTKWSDQVQVYPNPIAEGALTISLPEVTDANHQL